MNAIPDSWPSFIDYANAGFLDAVVPVMPPGAKLSPDSRVAPEMRGKVPGQFSTMYGTWVGMADWPSRDFTRDDLRKWDRWQPRPNIGVRAAYFPGADLDCEDRAIVDAVTKLAFEKLGATIIRRREGSERVLLPYRLQDGEEPPPKIRIAFTMPGDDTVHAVELLGRGQQYLVEGIHPSGKRYFWEDFGLSQVSAAALSQVSSARWVEFAAKVEALLVANGAVVKTAAAGAMLDQRRDIGDDSLRAHDLTALAAAVQAIPVADLEYPAWIGMLHAIKAACGGDTAFLLDVVVPWSLKHPQAGDQQWVVDKWDTVSTSSIGAEFVFGQARAAGWTDSRVDAVFEDLPPDADTAVSEKTNSAGTIVKIRSGLDIVPRNVSWVWGGHLAEGKLHIIAGTGGDGKTTIALLIAATISTGSSWPDGTHAPRGDVLIWSGEDDAEDTLLPRFIANGGDRARFHDVGTVQEHGKERPFDPAKDMADLTRAAAALPDLKLIIVDPIVSAVAGDSHKAAEVRRALLPIIRFADKTGCAVVGVAHFNKASAGKSPLERVNGSGAFGQAGRIVYGTARCDGDGDHRIMVRAKSNIGPDGDGWQYRLERVQVLDTIEAQRAVWEKPLKGQARDLLNVAEGVIDEPKRTTRKDEAGSFLRGLLAAGPAAVKTIEDEAEKAGLAWRTVRRAADRIGVIKKKDGSGGWVWRMATTPEELFDEAGKAA